jgi:GNAT superfamily N-acetyltransferase
MKVWATNDDVDDSFLRAIREGVIGVGRSLSQSLGGHPTSIACVLSQESSLIGGATGRTEFQRLFVDLLWIDEQWRGNGMGAKVLHKLEALAMERGCVDSIIETMDDGIADWYQRTGYELVAKVTKYCGPWNRHTLVKSLDAKAGEYHSPL